MLGGVWVVWVCACLPLAVLPYGGGRERWHSVEGIRHQVVQNLAWARTVGIDVDPGEIDLEGNAGIS